MIRINEIIKKLLHLVGWQPNYNTSELKIADELTESESGLYFQQAHPLITLQNLACIAPVSSANSYPEYSIDTTYAPGSIVKFNGKLYKAKKLSTGVPPVPDSGNSIQEETWEETNIFSEWLKQKTEASIQRMVSRFVNEKLAKSTSKIILDNKTIFSGTGRLYDTIETDTRKNIVGFEIVPIRAKGITTKINKIGLQFTAPGEYKLLLYHSSCCAPIREFSFIKTKSNSMEWFTVDNVYLPYESDGIDAGGSWYLVYNRLDLPEGSKAIRKDKDWSKGPCKACSREEFISWSAWSKYIEFHPFYVNSKNAENENELWDIENNIYTYDTNYGINLDITISCDITDFIIEQRYLFQDILCKQLAADMLKEFIYNANARTNRNAINASKVDILYELDGDNSSMKKSGLNYQLDEAYKALAISTEGINRVCLPCVNNGIKYRSI